jgi:pimeloyl-ACP methyl ester carboxylesterase
MSEENKNIVTAFYQTAESKQTAEGVGRESTGLTTLQFKTIDGLKIRYATSAATKGDPILLLGPWPESIYAYLPTWDIFTALGTVVAVDLPGFGRSESRPGIVAPEAMGEFIPHILEAFGLHQPHVVGPDIGTPALLYAAANHPGLFKSMIIGGGATDHTDIGGILDELVNAPSLEPYKNLTGAEFVYGATENMKRYKLPDDALQDYLASYEGDRFFESVKFVRDYPQALPRLAKRLSEIKTPCQIIVGRHDPYVPVSNAEGLHKGLPTSKLDILDCGHFAWEDGAAEYGGLASEWIKGGYARLSF